mmetsp:Transcript_21605/g.26755  ORF Transcript_21605/g.26755 Transcript_21605/m.26755 type:complete len:392 (+) Transcript_21605:73-1248(+)
MSRRSSSPHRFASAQPLLKAAPPLPEPEISSKTKKAKRKESMSSLLSVFNMSGVRFMVLLVLCFQNSIYTVLRRYSQGILSETYSKYEVLMVAEVVKILFSARVISQSDAADGGGSAGVSFSARLSTLVSKSWKMAFLAIMYGAMNILSFVALRNIGAGMFTIFAQCKILTTAGFSSLMLGRRYSMPRWRAMLQLMLGVLLFSEPIWKKLEGGGVIEEEKEIGRSYVIGVTAVLTEVTLSGFASIYFERVIKSDPEKMTIWERNFQLALWSFPIYIVFILYEGGGKAGYGGGWSGVTVLLALLGAAGGLLVALSIKYGDSILKTLATTGAIVLSSLLDHLWLSGPLTPVMMIAGVQVVLAICNYTFDLTPVESVSRPTEQEVAPLTSEQKC